MVEIEVLALIGIVIAVGLFLIGFFVGKKSDAKMELIMKKAITKALNINRELDGENESEAMLFVDEDDKEIKGQRTVSFSVRTPLTIVDLKNKKKHTEGGTVDLTDAEVKKYRESRQFRKTPI